jgi:hypothetical protein
MSALSEQLNPECEHVIGDLRSMRLGRTFDAARAGPQSSLPTTSARRSKSTR